MRVSKFYLATLKEAPAEADVISQQLMLRTGMIKKLGSGLYTWMPLGLRTLRKVERIIREEMDRAGAQRTHHGAVAPRARLGVHGDPAAALAQDRGAGR